MRFNVTSSVICVLLFVALGAKGVSTVPELVEAYGSSSSTEVSYYALSTPEGDGAAGGYPEILEEAGQCEEAPEFVLGMISEERSLLAAEQERVSNLTAEVELAKEKLGVEKLMLQELKSEVEGLIRKVEATHTDDVDRLVSLYSKMKAAQAAKIMDDLDVELTVMVLGSMKEASAAPILANMDIVRAQAISKIIYERSKLPGDQKLNGIKLK